MFVTRKMKIVSSKTYKVVFIKHTELPTNLAKRLVLLEGIVTISLNDDEFVIMDSLKSCLGYQISKSYFWQLLKRVTGNLHI